MRFNPLQEAIKQSVRLSIIAKFSLRHTLPEEIIHRLVVVVTAGIQCATAARRTGEVTLGFIKTPLLLRAMSQ